jgi:hypothetical protein
MISSPKKLQEKAEVLFADACSERGYKANKIAERNDSKTPDFLVQTQKIDFIAEVKSPGIEPQVQEHLNGKEGAFTFKPGKLVRSLLKQSSKQLAVNPNNLPSALVICDLRHYLPDYPLRPWFHFGPDHISAGMFGETVFGFARENNQDDWKSTGPRLGGNRTLRPSEKAHISALVLLLCNEINSPGVFFIYHNPFTNHLFPTDVFNAQNDRHFQLRVDGNVLLNEWEQFH